jgi:hypothetical protein
VQAFDLKESKKKKLPGLDAGLLPVTEQSHCIARTFFGNLFSD